MINFRTALMVFISLLTFSLVLTGCGGDNDQSYSQRGGQAASSEHLTPVDQTQTTSPPVPPTHLTPPPEPTEPLNTSVENSDILEPSQDEPLPSDDPQQPDLQKPPKDNPLIGKWVRIDKLGKTHSVEFSSDGRWHRILPDRPDNQGTYTLKQRNGLVIKEDEPSEYHEYGLITKYEIIEENGKILLGIRGFIGATPNYKKQTS